MTEKDRILPRRERFLVALLTEKSIGAAASAAGLSARQARRIMRDPAFRAELDAARQETLALVTARLAESATEALDVLMSIAGNRIENAATRVQAAKAILAFALGTPDGKRQTTVTVDGAVNPIKFIEVWLSPDSPNVE